MYKLCWLDPFRAGYFSTSSFSRCGGAFSLRAIGWPNGRGASMSILLLQKLHKFAREERSLSIVGWMYIIWLAYMSKERVSATPPVGGDWTKMSTEINWGFVDVWRFKSYQNLVVTDWNTSLLSALFSFLILLLKCFIYSSWSYKLIVSNLVFNPLRSCCYPSESNNSSMYVLQHCETFAQIWTNNNVCATWAHFADVNLPFDDGHLAIMYNRVSLACSTLQICGQKKS